MVRTLMAGLAVSALNLIAMSPVVADHGPYFRPDGGIVYGDWGLYRPGHMASWVEYPYGYFKSYHAGFYTGPYLVSKDRGVVPMSAPPAAGPAVPFFPSNRGDGGAYRQPRPAGPPVPAPSFFRSWGTSSGGYHDSGATVYPPFSPPEVIYAPRERPWRER